MTLEADTLEEKVFQMQVFYERLIISRVPADRPLVARHGARRSLQPADDGRRHPPRRGMAYEKSAAAERLEADEAKLVDAANRLLPTFVEHALWRPKERCLHRPGDAHRDIERLEGRPRDRRSDWRESLGLDVSEVQLPTL